MQRYCVPQELSSSLCFRGRRIRVDPEQTRRELQLAPKKDQHRHLDDAIQRSAMSSVDAGAKIAGDASPNPSAKDGGWIKVVSKGKPNQAAASGGKAAAAASSAAGGERVEPHAASNASGGIAQPAGKKASPIRAAIEHAKEQQSTVGSFDDAKPIQLGGWSEHPGGVPQSVRDLPRSLEFNLAMEQMDKKLQRLADALFERIDDVRGGGGYDSSSHGSD